MRFVTAPNAAQPGIPIYRKIWSVPLILKSTIVYDRELYGEPDYLVSAMIEGVIDKLINKPFLAVAEAKKEDFARGWAQCLAEMIACQKINEDESVVIYGIVPTGLIWEFGKLEQNTFTIVNSKNKWTLSPLR